MWEPRTHDSTSAVNVPKRHSKPAPVRANHLQRRRVPLPARRNDSYLSGDVPVAADQGTAPRIITRNKISLTNPMPLSYRHKIAQIPGVRPVTVGQWFGGVYKDPKYFFGRVAIEPEYFEKVYPEYKLIQGSMEDFKKERMACVIGKDLAKKFDLKLGDRMTLIGDIFP